jgi:hypothetical protein
MYFLFQVTAGSVIGALLGTWFARRVDFVPASLKRRYTFIITAGYTLIVTVALTLMPVLHIEFTWLLLIALSFFAWSFSAWGAGMIAKMKGDSLQPDLPPSINR